MTFYSLRDHSPNLYEPSTCWFAPNCNIVGRVVISGNVSVWFGSVIRGDNEEIQIGDGSNIQENSILHTDMDWPLLVGAGCTIGHGCILHGCKLGSNCLVGMGSIVLNGAEIGNNCIIGAGSLIVQKQVIPDGSLVFGRPGKVIRHLSQAEINTNKKAAIIYNDKIDAYRNGLKVIPN